MSEVLIATLGTEAQVVTLSLLELERLDFSVDEVVIVRTSGTVQTIQDSLARLDEAFVTDDRLKKYRKQPTTQGRLPNHPLLIFPKQTTHQRRFLSYSPGPLCRGIEADDDLLKIYLRRFQLLFHPGFTGRSRLC